jgi:hypothetical protein
LETETLSITILNNWNSTTTYKCDVFQKIKLPRIYQFVKSICYLHEAVRKENYDYHYINIYNRKTGQYLSDNILINLL